MSESVSTTNFLIHDANGQPQVIKVLHTGSGKGTKFTPGKSVIRSSIFKSSTSSTPVRKIFVEEDNVIGPGSPTLLKAKYNSTPTQSNTIKVFNGSSASVTQKTVQLTTSQLQAISNQSNNVRKPSPSQSYNCQSKIFAKSVVNSSSKKSASVNTDSDISLSMTDYKRRRADKLGKGLRHFSMKVCEKVRQKGTTSYNEVADELVAEFTGTPYKPNQEQNYDQKNIRRRVYDALNVLMAMNIISKEKKEIRWIGLPSTILEADKDSEREKKQRLERIAQKTQDLHNLILQQIAFKNLVERNKKLEKKGGRPAQTTAVELPFLVVNTSRETMVNCSVSNDKTEYLFNFDDKFEIQDDMHVLKGMGMMMGLNTRECNPESVNKARKMVPRSLEPFVLQMCRQELEEDEDGSSALQNYSNQSEFIEEYLEDESDIASDLDTDVQ
ncbi:hypothetical protein RUM43_008462 [Polyplax serrata]|uniref:Transcription factor Dp-1 n=1 Tax=Polyplax serrata TaxID=468196 RepID=A0AAN8NTM2_POLSC